MNAIDRLRAERPDDFDVESYDAALAAVDALYQAALEATRWRNSAPGNDYPATKEGLDVLAAAVRQVEGE